MNSAPAFLVLRASIALVLVAAGGAKLADRAGFKETLKRLGAPSWGADIGSTIIPAFEVCLGVCSLIGVAAFAIDVLVLSLTLGFVGTSLYAMRLTPGLVCRCFGAFRNSPFGWRGLVRSSGLALGAAVIALSSGSLSPSYSAPFTLRLLIIVVGLLVALGFGEAARAADGIRRGRSG